MDESMVDNRLKYENYKEQFRRLNKALVNGFNLEAMFIEYWQARIHPVCRWRIRLPQCHGGTGGYDGQAERKSTA